MKAGRCWKMLEICLSLLHNLEFLFLYMILPFSESAFISDSTDDSNRAGHLLEGLDVAPAESYPQEYSGQVVRVT